MLDGKYGEWKKRCMENEEYGKRGVWKIRIVEKAESLSLVDKP